MKENNYHIPQNLSQLLKKKILGRDFDGAQTVREEDASNQFQLFEVMIGETINAIYDDFIWYTSSIQGDGGIDFYGEKIARDLPFNWKSPPLIIYGQVKYRSGAIRKSEIENATKAIIDYHRENTLQKKSIYEIIHVIKSSKLIDISYGETVSVSNIDTRHYILNIINAEDFFKIWILNKDFLRKILPNSLSTEEYKIITGFFNGIKYGWSELIETTISVDYNQSIERTFMCNITFKNKIYISTEFIIKLVPSKGNVLNVVQPVKLLSAEGLRIKILKSYNLQIHFLPTVLGHASLGVLQVFDTDMNLLFQNELGAVDVDSRFNPTYFSAPNSSISEEIKKEFFNESDKLAIYSLTGEGGIGKSTFVNDITVFGANHGFKTINYEHLCKLIDDNMVLVELFLYVIGIDDLDFLTLEDKMQQVKKFFGVYFNDDWEHQLKNFLNTGYYTNLNILIDCWLSALLLVTDKQPIFIHLSNLHWSSPNLIIFFNSLVKALRNKSSYFNKKVIIIFEGRTSEIIYDDFKRHIPHEWIDFTQNGYTKNINLTKWSDEDSRIYVTSLFKHENLVDFQKQNIIKVIDKIVKNSSGNPMHINELVRHLIEVNCLALDETGYIRILNFESEKLISKTLLDIIKLRLSYFAEKYSEVMDYIILYLNAEECDSLSISKIILSKLENMYDVRSLFREMEFVFVEGSIIKVSHEHYRNALKTLKISNDKNAFSLLQCAQEKGILLSPISKNRLLLMTKVPEYQIIAKNIINLFREGEDAHTKYTLLMLLYQIPDNVLDSVHFPRYCLLSNLQEASMNLGDWNTAIGYIEQIKSTNDNSAEYMLCCAKAQLALSNIYGIKLDLYRAINEAEDAIKTVEFFLENQRNLSEKEVFQFSRILSLLYNRLAIEFYMSGQREKAEDIDLKALIIALESNDQYVENHIKYENGVRLLHKNTEDAKEMIREAKENISIPVGFLVRQEKDLINADYLMAKLLCAENNDNKYIKEIYNESHKLCKELSTTQEPFESALAHTICAITCILCQEYSRALECFYIAVTMSERASIDSFIWKSYLNIAQLYLLLASTTNYIDYKKDAVFYASEVKHIIKRGLLKNLDLSSNVEKVFNYPLNIAQSIINGTKVVNNEVEKKTCALHVDYKSFSFFMLD